MIAYKEHYIFKISDSALLKMSSKIIIYSLAYHPRSSSQLKLLNDLLPMVSYGN